MLANDRRHHILSEIQQSGRVQTSQLSAELGVSRMTVHRDLTALAEEGLVRKVFGGAIAVERRTEPEACVLCGMRVRQRSMFVLNDAAGVQTKACCPHCGLMLLAQRHDIVSGLTADFLHGRMINVRTAVFLVNTELTVCCTPAVLCFQRRHEAERFQMGFGGEIMDMKQAQAYLDESMRIEHSA